jgi:hypothetical protein
MMLNFGGVCAPAAPAPPIPARAAQTRTAIHRIVCFMHPLLV